MNSNENNRLRIAIQKSGRLSEDSLNLLRCCGIKIKHNPMQLFTHCEDFNLDILYVRDDDIPNLVAKDICDLGIVGTNVLQEEILVDSQSFENQSIKQWRALNFGQCRLAIAAPDEFSFDNINCLNTKRIATSYPNILKQFLAQKQITAEVIQLTGSVEIAPRLGIADIICDLVSTGSTLEANGLREIVTIFESIAVLIQNTSINNNPIKKDLLTRLTQRIDGVLTSNDSKYIMLHINKEAVSDITSILPGVENPTLMPLESDKNKVALHAVCRETIFWDTMEKLKAIGASSILVLPIEKMLA